MMFFDDKPTPPWRGAVALPAVFGNSCSMGLGQLGRLCGGKCIFTDRRQWSRRAEPRKGGDEGHGRSD